MIAIQNDVPIKQFSLYKIGGPARFFGEAKSWEELLFLRDFAQKKNLPYCLINSESNLLFPDEGYKGMVILNKMRKVRFYGNTVTAESGVNLSKLILLAAQKHLGGMSGLANVPGSVGDAVYGNAGIVEVCMADLLLHATILPKNSRQPLIVGPDYCQWTHRNSALKQGEDLVLCATLQLQSVPSIMVRSEINRHLSNRPQKKAQSLSWGHFFKNPNTFPSAEWLVEQSGYKKIKVGGAQTTPQKTHFILNTEKATSKDLLQLALKIHQKVKRKFGTHLEPDVHIFSKNPFLKKK